MSVRDLIDAIYVGDSESIETAFNHEMAERISTRLDAMRVEVAKNMFNEQVEELDEEQLDELNVNQIKKDLDSGMSTDAVIGKHANKRTTNTSEIRKVIQQHAWDKRMKSKTNEQVEELDEQEEELDEEHLDELSKDTLKSYVDKAATRLVSGDKYKGMDRYNRVDGIKKATSKLVKQEETE